MDALALEPGQPCGWVSATRETLRKFLMQHFPTHRNPKATAAQQAEAAKRAAEAAGAPLPPAKAAAVAAKAAAAAAKGGAAGKGVVVQECLRMRAKLIARAEGLQLPPHFLDGARAAPTPRVCMLPLRDLLLLFILPVTWEHCIWEAHIGRVHQGFCVPPGMPARVTIAAVCMCRAD